LIVVTIFQWIFYQHLSSGEVNSQNIKSLCSWFYVWQMGNSYIPQHDGLVLQSTCGLDMPSINSIPQTETANIAKKNWQTTSPEHNAKTKTLK